MSLLGSLRKGYESAGRFISTTGKGALRKVGETARSIRKFAGDVNSVTGGAAGIAWDAAKAHPTFGKVATGVEAGLDAAIKGSDMGLRAIELGERASKVKGVKDARGVYQDASALYKQVRKR